MATIISTLAEPNSIPFKFPCWFKYKPYIPKKRYKVIQTCKGSYVQRTKPTFLHGTEFIEWTIEVASPEVAKTLNEYYKLNVNFIFTGAWSDVYVVDFVEYDMDPFAGYFKLSGKFRVVCVLSELSPKCPPTT